MSRYTITTLQDITGFAPRDSIWTACFGDFDLDVPTGTGPTEAAAIADLLDNYKAPWGDADYKEST